ncbi:MAG: very short patch repair endonuclease [Verrucomicrobiota bacterium]
MPDVFSKAKRSELMGRIRSSGNRETEGALAKILRRHHVTGWRRKMALFGKPDFTFRAQRVAVFVDGCFWHGCPKHGTRPRHNRAFWQRKLSGNRARDRKVNRALRAQGWRVVRIWEHDLRNGARLLGRLRRALAGRVC